MKKLLNLKIYTNRYVIGTHLEYSLLSLRMLLHVTYFDSFGDDSPSDGGSDESLLDDGDIEYFLDGIPDFCGESDPSRLRDLYRKNNI